MFQGQNGDFLHYILPNNWLLCDLSNITMLKNQMAKNPQIIFLNSYFLFMCPLKIVVQIFPVELFYAIEF